MTEAVCANCKHVVREDIQTLRCRRNPPTAQVFMVPPTIHGQPPGQLNVSSFPVTQAKWSCGEHSPKALASALNS